MVFLFRKWLFFFELLEPINKLLLLEVVLMLLTFDGGKSWVSKLDDDSVKDDDFSLFTEFKQLDIVRRWFCFLNLVLSVISELA